MPTNLEKAALRSYIEDEVHGDPFESDFWQGFSAFRDGAGVLDNPHFAQRGAVKRFDAWSDGWHDARDIELPLKRRLLTWLKAKRDWPSHSLRGITATWGC